MSAVELRPSSSSRWLAVYAVRRDWPDGSHEFVGARDSKADAQRFVERDRQYWLPGPLRPEWSVVEISVRDFDLHAKRYGCRAPDCPIGASSEPSGRADRW
jgi:hypothetical protein